MLSKILSKFCHATHSQLSFSDLRVFRHAFATPVTSLLLSLEQLSLLEKNTTTGTHLDIAYRSAQRLESLLESVSFKHSQTSLHQSFDIISAVSELKVFFTRQQLKLVIADQLDERLSLVGSKLYFQEALINLIKNAFEAYLPNQRGVVLVTIHRFEHSLEIDIIDFAHHQKGHIPIKTFGGWGVGLPFAKKVIQGMFSGTLQFSIFKTRGSHATIILPIHFTP